MPYSSKSTRSWLAALVIGAACAKPAPSQPASPASTAVAYPMLDGRCDEYAALAQERHAIADGVELFLFQDRDYVWVCYTVPDGSFGTLNLVLSAPGLTEPLNLHVSAQLGEWPADRPELGPNDSNSELWWNQHGWASLPVPFNGLTPDQKFKWKPTPGRELQLGKARFGRGSWRMRFLIRAIKNQAGESLAPVFPANGDHVLTVS